MSERHRVVDRVMVPWAAATAAVLRREVAAERASDFDRGARRKNYR
jgi:hypothetical protein